MEQKPVPLKEVLKIIADRPRRPRLRLVGSGSYSNVYAYPGDKTKVIKVSHALSDAWIQFGMYCMNSNNPLCPRVYYLHIFDGYYVSVIEKCRRTIDHMQSLIRRGKIDEILDQYEYINGDNYSDQYSWMDKHLEAISDHVYMDDLHAGNIMQAYDGRIVIIDPSCDDYAYSYDDPKLRRGIRRKHGCKSSKAKTTKREKGQPYRLAA